MLFEHFHPFHKRSSDRNNLVSSPVKDRAQVVGFNKLVFDDKYFQLHTYEMDDSGAVTVHEWGLQPGCLIIDAVRQIMETVDNSVSNNTYWRKQGLSAVKNIF